MHKTKTMARTFFFDEAFLPVTMGCLDKQVLVLGFDFVAQSSMCAVVDLEACALVRQFPTAMYGDTWTAEEIAGRKTRGCHLVVGFGSVAFVACIRSPIVQVIDAEGRVVQSLGGFERSVVAVGRNLRGDALTVVLEGGELQLFHRDSEDSVTWIPWMKRRGSVSLPQPCFHWPFLPSADGDDVLLTDDGHCHLTLKVDCGQLIASAVLSSTVNCALKARLA